MFNIWSVILYWIWILGAQNWNIVVENYKCSLNLWRFAMFNIWSGMSFFSLFFLFAIKDYYNWYLLTLVLDLEYWKCIFHYIRFWFEAQIWVLKIYLFRKSFLEETWKQLRGREPNYYKHYATVSVPKLWKRQRWLAICCKLL